MQQAIRNGGDLISAGGLVATLMGYLPAIAAGITIAWTAARLTEMFTGRPFHETRFAQLVVGAVRRILPAKKV